MVEDKYAIHVAMQGILDAVVVTFTDAGVDPPERQFVTVGSVVHDCEQIAVKFEQLYHGPPGAQADEPLPCNNPRTMVLQVHVVTCIPTIRTRQSVTIDVDELMEANQRLSSYAWLLLDGVNASPAADYLGLLCDVTIGEPSGGFQAVVANLSVGIP